MPPRLSLVLFNRICSIDLEAFKDIVDKLQNLTVNETHYLQDAILLYSCLTEEYSKINDRFEAYKNQEVLPDDMTEELLQAGISKLNNLYQKGKLSYNRLSTPAPLANSTVINPPSLLNPGLSHGNISNSVSLANSTLLPTSELPRLSIPIFDGKNVNNFNEFHSKFISLVDENPLLTPKQKLLYLLNHLREAAYEKVALLPINDDSYQIALKTLTDRYLNKKLFSKSYCNKLLNLPSVSLDAPASMRDFIDTYNLNFAYLKSLGNEDIYEAIYVTFMLSHFDLKLKMKFESSQVNNDNYLPKVNDLITFLTNTAVQRENALSCNYFDKTDHSLNSYKPVSKVKNNSKLTRTNSKFTNNFKGASSMTVSDNSLMCSLCENKHPVKECPRFLCLNPRERFKLLKANKLCISCLRSKHVGVCVPAVYCGKCQSPHHNSLLHFDDIKSAPADKPLQAAIPSVAPVYTAQSCVSVSDSTSVLMATCLVRVQVTPHKFLIVRGVLDSASQLSFITEACVQRLGVKRSSIPINISGIGLSSPPPSKGVCNLAVACINGNILSECHTFHILANIAHMTPRVPISPSVFKAAKDLVLADPTFGQPSKVDILLGADFVASVLNGPVVPLGPGLPYAVSTKFGFVIMGRAPIAPDCCSMCVDNSSLLNLDLVSKSSFPHNHMSELCYAGTHLNATELSLTSVPNFCSPLRENIFDRTCLISICEDDSNLNNSIKRFWEIEEPPEAGPYLSDEENKCEEFYTSTTTRNPLGRYVVRLPFKDDSVSLIGDSFREAITRFHSLERKFVKNPEFKSLYVDFMREYLSLGHMVPVLDFKFPKYYVPHHGIFKTHGNQNKIRVVYDFSAKTNSGYSLNDILMTGKGLQSLICDIITLFRRYRYVFCSDIQQMFRQILVHHDDCAFQCILWRENSTDPIMTYMLCTVTYGMTCAPYLAIRSLFRLAHDEGADFLLASRAIYQNVFVDDFASGSDTHEQASILINQLIELLLKGGFILKKWASNCPELLSQVSIEDQVKDNLFHSVLGLRWDPKSDVLFYPVDEMIAYLPSPLTKRAVMSQVARLYDPCGYIAPIVFHAKCFMQTLWRTSLDWDSPLPSELSAQWSDFVTSLRILSDLTIPRYLDISDKIQLHGFSDASQSGYSAVLYVRSVNMGGISCKLLASKTKVAPLKTLSIPRLELQGAHLLSKLVNHYRRLLNPQLSISDIFLWADSTIVLQWIKTPPHSLKIFVANRVAQISDFCEDAHWLWVPSEDNPADIASRGCNPSNFLQCKIWFKGPSWLSLDSAFWPSQNFNSIGFNPEDLELKDPKDNVLISVCPEVCLFSKISSWRMVLKVMVLLLKWIPKIPASLSKLDKHELALMYLMRYIQRQTFPDELSQVSKGASVRVAIQRLVPFLDDFGLLRARGRLSNIDGDSRFPIILPKHHNLVHLLIHHTHNQLGHAGPQQVQYQLSVDYWILSARQVIRSIVNKCVVCFRVKPRSLPPLMADLPSERVNPAPVFYHAGMDYCGPFHLKAYPLRKAPLVKTYVCIFICFAVKAIHLELALDMSTDAFIDVLRRFISRRGCPKCLFSDSGTNFVGGERALNKELKAILMDPDNSNLILNFATDNKIEFSFLPPSSPSMGGLWERAVQSTKYHLKRVIGNNVLTVQQFNSLLVQVEGILNSRPITALSSEPNDCQVLTPGHFLIGRPITIPPERDLTFLKDGVLGHFQLVQALLGRFWKQWRVEYLSSLQARAKWFKQTPNPEVGDIVILEEPNCAPLHWPLGRITQVFPAKDGVIRKVEVQTASGKYFRSVLKIYILPLKED